MPTPEIDPIPLPTDLGPTAKEYLEHHGLMATVPTIRSSDYSLALRSPRLYYLIRRLGLIPALRWSEAMNRGSWFHTILGLYRAPNRRAVYAKLVLKRIDELKAYCDTAHIGTERMLAIIDREHLDAATALGWFEALETVEIHNQTTGEKFTIRQFLDQPRWKHLGSEVRIVRPHKINGKEVLMVIQLDCLLYDRDSNKLWIFDGKTTSETPLSRVATVKHEFQTQHYMVTTDWAIETGLLQSKFDLPDDVTLGGMMHCPVWKPGIRFGMKDRPHRWYSEGKRTGMCGTVIRAAGDEGYDVVVGEIGSDQDWSPTTTAPTMEEALKILHEITGKKPEKQFTGEPDLRHFVTRLQEAYKGYEEKLLGEGKLAEPPVNLTWTTHAVLLDKDWLTDYWDCVQYIHSHAVRTAIPENFLPPDMREIRGSEYEPFFTNPPAAWPEIVRDRHFITARRDDDLEGTTDAIIDQLQEN